MLKLVEYLPLIYVTQTLCKVNDVQYVVETQVGKVKNVS